MCRGSEWFLIENPRFTLLLFCPSSFDWYTGGIRLPEIATERDDARVGKLNVLQEKRMAVGGSRAVGSDAASQLEFRGEDTEP